VIAVPPAAGAEFQCIWATGTGWGTFSLRRQQHGVTFALKVLAGSLACRSCEIAAGGTTAKASSGGRTIENRVDRREDRAIVSFAEILRIPVNGEVTVEVSS
jgi:non-lysosomal glucosylceramidase